MTRLLLRVSHHQTCGEGVVLHYEVRVTTAAGEVIEFVGRFPRLPATDYEIEVARVPGDAKAELLTPDSRLVLIEALDVHVD